MSTPDEHRHDRVVGGEHAVTPLELFFVLVFVFALTQVTTLLAEDLTWIGMLRGFAVLAVAIMFFYNLDNTKLIQIQADLEARKTT